MCRWNFFQLSCCYFLVTSPVKISGSGIWLTSLSAQHCLSTADIAGDIPLLYTAHAKASRSRGQGTWSLCSWMFYLSYTVSFQTRGKVVLPLYNLVFCWCLALQGSTPFFFQQINVNWWGGCLCLLKLDWSYPTAWTNECVLLFQGVSTHPKIKINTCFWMYLLQKKVSLH